jgi:hypothetical protein
MEQTELEQQTETQQQAAEQVAETEQQKPNTTPDWVPKRMAEITAQRRAAEQRAEEERQRREALEAQLAQFQNGSEQTQQPHHNVQEMARIMAEQIVQERTGQQQLVDKLAGIEAAGKKEFGEKYDSAVNQLAMAGIGGPEFLNVVANVPNAEKVITWLGQADNVGEAIRLASLPPVQMAIEMAQLSTKAAKELSKQISKAPPPVTTVDGGGSGGDGAEPDPKNRKEWIEWRNKNARRR